MSISYKCRKAKPIFDPERQMIEEHLPEIGHIPDAARYFRISTVK